MWLCAVQGAQTHLTHLAEVDAVHNPTDDEEAQGEGPQQAALPVAQVVPLHTSEGEGGQGECAAHKALHGRLQHT